MSDGATVTGGTLTNNNLIAGTVDISGTGTVDNNATITGVVNNAATFNNNAGSTKSYDYVREHVEATATLDFVPYEREITTHYEAGEINDLLMHDGTTIRLHKLAKDWDPFDRFSAQTAIHNAKEKGEILTGLLFLDESSNDLHKMLNTSDTPLNKLGENSLCPGVEALAALNASLTISCASAKMRFKCASSTKLSA